MGTNHAVTEPATWDNAPPVVPDLDSDMDDATAVLEALAIKFGCRTQYLHAAVAAIPAPAPPDLTPYARKDAANTFTAAQRIESTLRVTSASTFESSITANVATVQALLIANTITCQADLSVGDDITATGSVRGAGITSTTGITALDGDITLSASKRVRYSGSVADRTRRALIPLCLASVTQQTVVAPAADAPCSVLEDSRILVRDEPVFIRLPVVIPPEATLLALSMYHYPSNGSDSITLVSKRIGDWTTVSQPPPHNTGHLTVTEVMTATSDSGGANNRMTRVEPPSPITLADDTEWTCKISMSAFNSLWAVRVEYALATAGE